MNSRSERINDRHKLFADHYIETLDAKESYRRVYGNAKNDAVLHANASRLLRNVNVRRYIEQEMSKKKQDRIASANEVLTLLTEIARGECEEEQIVTYKNSYEITKKKNSVRERTKALELLGKRYLMFSDRVKVEADVNVTEYMAEWDTDDNS